MNPLLGSLLPAGLAFIMFALGLKLGVSDFRRVILQPRAVGLGLLVQVFLLPVTAFVVAVSFDLKPEMAVGVMILAACPGGVTAAMITDLSRGDTCLSITLTAVTSLISFVTVPLIARMSLAYFMGQETAVGYPVAQTIGGLFLVTLAPAAAGLALHHNGWVTPGTSKLIGRMATAVFAAIVFATFYIQWPNITKHLAVIGSALLLLNLLTMATGAGLGYLVKLTREGRIALSVECGIQNSALGITVAVSLLSNAAFAVPSVVYAFLMNVTALVLITFRQLQGSREGGSAPGG